MAGEIDSQAVLLPATVRPAPVLTTDQSASAVPDEQRLRAWTTRPRPLWTQAPDRGTRPEDAGWWWLGVHGGAGVSTLDRWLPGGADAHRMWPDPAAGGPSLVILVARTHVPGLTQAAWALRQAATGDLPAGVRVAGVVAVADSPGAVGRPQEEALRRLRGIAPHLWLVPWIEELRLVLHPDELGAPHPTIVALFHDFTRLVDAEFASDH